MSFTELSQVHNVHISNDYYFWQATKSSVAAFLSKACNEKL